ncbi:DUF6301 family protein [Actinomadura miaoliensis]|uniref:TY-Chap N-terminal domain-containing protein n=1 Tax=Actinomadura miaoliensis TaxID=430685 RepID=A0ABP7WYL2_9ACTN
MTVRVTDAEIEELIRRFAALDMGEWDRAAVERAATELGWPIRRDYDRLALQASLSAGHARAYPDTTSDPRRDNGYQSLEYQLAELARGDDPQVLTEVFQAARRAAERRLGPAPIRGGDGPWLRWRRPVSLLEIERTSRTVELRLRPTQVVENAEYRVGKWGDRDFAVATIGSWLSVARRDASLEGLWLPGGFEAETWQDFQQWLAETLRALVSDVPCLGEDLVMVLSPGDGSGRFVQLTIDDAGLLHMEAGRMPDDPNTLAAMGWEEHDEYVVAIDLDTPTGPEVDTAARMLVETLRAHRVDLPELSHQAWFNNSDHDLILLGLGLP